MTIQDPTTPAAPATNGSRDDARMLAVGALVMLVGVLIRIPSSYLHPDFPRFSSAPEILGIIAAYEWWVPLHLAIFAGGLILCIGAATLAFGIASLTRGGTRALAYATASVALGILGLVLVLDGAGNHILWDYALRFQAADPVSQRFIAASAETVVFLDFNWYAHFYFLFYGLLLPLLAGTLAAARRIPWLLALPLILLGIPAGAVGLASMSGGLSDLLTNVIGPPVAGIQLVLLFVVVAWVAWAGFRDRDRSAA